ncbi:MAG: response regulator [Candidatus Omnitrophota bacterium]|jgi:CheY-like chemotaxis protein
MQERKIKVLVVDDERIVRDFFKRLLSILGLEVSDAEDGYKAIDMVKKDKFDLFFLDVRMPGMDGLETYRQIRKINTEAMVVMITGYAVEEILEQAQKEGVYSAIRKPFDINQIKDVLEKVGQEKAGGLLNILVVDDEEVVLNFFSTLLKGKNLKYKFARNGKEAAALAAEERFDLVFLDLVLKEESGLEVYEQIKKIIPKAQIVLITGYPQKAEEIKGKIELAGCLYKPFDIDSIVGYIEKIKAKING